MPDQQRMTCAFAITGNNLAANLIDEESCQIGVSLRVFVVIALQFLMEVLVPLFILSFVSYIEVALDDQIS